MKTAFTTNMWQCPICRSPLDSTKESEASLACSACGRIFARHGSAWNFLATAPVYNEKSNRLRDFFKRWPRFYYAIVIVFGPVFFQGLSPQRFLKKYSITPPVCNLGSGPKDFGSGSINVDLFPYPGVTVLADITRLPFKSESLGGVIVGDVFEHLKEPALVAEEIARVLRKGGYAYVSVPFLYPFHASPHDYNRWTIPGMWEVFKNFNLVEEGVRSGPFSALTVNLCYIVATLFSFGNERLYWLLVNLATFLFFPLKYLDVLVGKLPFAQHMAAELYYVIQKK
jgi:SAM-dependent methyltransferase